MDWQDDSPIKEFLKVKVNSSKLTVLTTPTEFTEDTPDFIYPKRSTEERKHTLSIESYNRNDLIDVFMLINEVKNNIRVKVSIGDLMEVPRTEKSGFCLGRLEAANLFYPIIINNNGIVLDGRHRLIKAMDYGHFEITAIVAEDSQIKKCIISKE